MSRMPMPPTRKPFAPAQKQFPGRSLPIKTTAAPAGSPIVLVILGGSPPSAPERRKPVSDRLRCGLSKEGHVHHPLLYVRCPVLFAGVNGGDDSDNLKGPVRVSRPRQ